MRPAEYWPLVKDTVKEFRDDKGPRLGAALAFYTALSLSPLLIVIVAMAGIFFGEAAARGELADQIRGMVGPDGARAVQTILAEQRSHQRGILMTVIGTVTLLIGATGIFGELQGALDTIWDLERKPASGIWGTIRDRLLSFLMVCGIVLLLLALLIASAVVSATSGWLEQHLAVGVWVVQLGNQVVSFAVTATLFAVIFKVLPHVRLAWKDVWTGALITAALFTLGKYLIGLYLAKAAPGSAYGAAGSFVVLLVWIYYSSQILLFGGEFTQLYANRFGSGQGRDLRSEALSNAGPPAKKTGDRANGAQSGRGHNRIGTRIANSRAAGSYGEDSIMIETPVSDGPRQTVTSTTTAEPTMTELVSGIADDAQRLMRQQYQMLRAEVREDIRHTKSAVKYLGVGIAAAALGVFFLLVALPLLINWGFGWPAFAGFAIVGGVLAILGGIALFAGKRIFEHNNPLPDKTLNALEENLSWITKHRS